VGITAVARQGQIGGVIRPLVLPRNDVFDVVRQSSVFLAEQTIFATVCGTLADEISRGGIHQEEPFKPR
jgi:hypothetical protein